MQSCAGGWWGAVRGGGLWVVARRHRLVTSPCCRAGALPFLAAIQFQRLGLADLRLLLCLSPGLLLRFCLLFGLRFLFWSSLHGVSNMVECPQQKLPLKSNKKLSCNGDRGWGVGEAGASGARILFVWKHTEKRLLKFGLKAGENSVSGSEWSSMGSTHHCKRSEVPPEAIDRQHSTPFCQGPAEEAAVV